MILRNRDSNELCDNLRALLSTNSKLLTKINDFSGIEGSPLGVILLGFIFSAEVVPKLVFGMRTLPLGLLCRASPCSLIGRFQSVSGAGDVAQPSEMSSVK